MSDINDGQQCDLEVKLTYNITSEFYNLKTSRIKILVSFIDAAALCNMVDKFHRITFSKHSSKFYAKQLFIL